MASACIANRLKTVLPDIISEEQKGFMKGRFIGESTGLLYDIIYQSKLHNRTGLLLLIDSEKAFDSISWKFIQNVLKYFQFGPSFRNWVDILYKNSSLLEGKITSKELANSLSQMKNNKSPGLDGFKFFWPNLIFVYP